MAPRRRAASDGSVFLLSRPCLVDALILKIGTEFARRGSAQLGPVRPRMTVKGPKDRENSGFADVGDDFGSSNLNRILGVV